MSSGRTPGDIKASILVKKEGQRREARSEINRQIKYLQSELKWAEEHIEMKAHERANRLIKTMRKLEREVLGYGRLLP